DVTHNVTPAERLSCDPYRRTARSFSQLNTAALHIANVAPDRELRSTGLPGLDDEGGRHHLRPSHRIPARRIDVFLLHSRRSDWRLHQCFDLQPRVNDLSKKCAESTTVRDDRNTLPRGVFAGAFGEVR